MQKIVEKIEQWLKIIPHSNDFFAKQEAKNKAQQIMDLIDDKKNN